MEGAGGATRFILPVRVHERRITGPESDRRIRGGQRGEAKGRGEEIRPGSDLPDPAEQRVLAFEDVERSFIDILYCTLAGHVDSDLF